MPQIDRHADTPLQISPRGWWQVLRRTVQQTGEDNLDIVAAGVAFYGFLALIPLLAAMVLTYGLIVAPAEAARHIRELAVMVPAEALTIIDDQLRGIVTAAQAKKGIGLAIALAVALFGAMKGAGAIITALNIAYGETETRGIIRTTFMKILLVVGAVALAATLVIAASVTAFFNRLVQDFGPVAIRTIGILSWLAAATIVSLGIALLYRFAPARRAAKWRWITPGSIFALLGLIAATAGFAFYATNFAGYNATYGALGSVVVLLMWLYIAAFVLMLGAELNAELERQTARDSTRGPDRPMGQRGARMADTTVTT